MRLSVIPQDILKKLSRNAKEQVGIQSPCSAASSLLARQPGSGRPPPILCMPLPRCTASSSSSSAQHATSPPSLSTPARGALTVQESYLSTPASPHLYSLLTAAAAVYCLVATLVPQEADPDGVDSSFSRLFKINRPEWGHAGVGVASSCARDSVLRLALSQATRTLACMARC